VLSEDQVARPAPRSTGLYHFAILFPSQVDLAQELRRLVESGGKIGGVADHGVSEAIYLSDPEGNGIELYRDRPKEEWPRDHNGKIAMVTDPLDLDSLMNTLKEQPQPQNGIPKGTRLGHIHLKVRDAQESIRFYTHVLGFDLMDQFGPSAGFVATGGYHHQVGMNTWESAGAPPPPPGSLGLEYYELIYPDQNELEAVLQRVRETGIEPADVFDGTMINDPSGNRILVANTRPASTPAGAPRD
jgi:catechol 2,3-dioxygenase